MMNILPFIDENSLKTIELLNLSHPEFMVVTEQFRFEVDQISQTNQWKSAGQLISKHLTIKTPIQEMHILHFADLEILVGTLSSEDVAYLKTLGNVIHELLHCLGIMHSMSRYDRDKFLKINYESMDDTDRLNYDYYDSTESIQAVPFEYGSAMTYSSNSIAQPRNEQYLYTMGNRRTTFYDIYALYTAYQCSCPSKIDCKNGGVPNAADCTVCFCPDGFGGKFCEDAPNFSKTLMAEAEWAEFSTSFGYDGLSEWEFKDFTIFIEAPKDKTIQVILSRMDNFGCLVRCSWNGVEIKHMGDPRITNPLICCTDHSLFNSTVTSKLNPTPVILYTRGSKQEITLKYRFIDRNLADLPKTNNSFDSFEYPL
ncbi:hypothetical protein B9Z55_026768 [Caenorhabditis nigoni]|uniref:Metalloendopeptidase n=2 Tax=Caenorhabditis nigoni TaxID=1611254 RepID=A0A2G5SHB0_9PELO|nr:hypothetical protein B9Z55_026768 [Caenorhabditis nigoni]